MTAKNKTPNIRINKVYTRSGDSGKTSLIGGVKCYKDDLKVEAYGTIDELIAKLGLCRELLRDENNKNFDSIEQFLFSIQNQLFDLGTQLASPENNSKELPHLSENMVSNLELEIDRINSFLSELTSFILPGGSILNTNFHVARTICRRAERRVVSLSKIEKIDKINIKYLNRLSDTLFIWSRYINKELDVKESLWKPNY